MNIDPPTRIYDLNIDPPMRIYDLNIDPPMRIYDLNIDLPTRIYGLNIDPVLDYIYIVKIMCHVTIMLHKLAVIDMAVMMADLFGGRNAETRNPFPRIVEV